MAVTSLSERLAEVHARIRRACHAAGREPADITLIAVSKVQPAEAVLAAVAAGQTVFGENRVQEAVGKFAFQGRDQLELHLIGPLQTNKVKQALTTFDVIQTVDSERLASKLADTQSRLGVTRRFFVQVNTGEESQKSGVLPEHVGTLVDHCREDLGLDVQGLMCIPPVADPPEPHFALLRGMSERLALPGLSMGMSGDYETAIRLGATHVRVGTGVFGPRPSR